MDDDDRLVINGALPSIQPVGAMPKDGRVVLDLPAWMFEALERKRVERGLRSRQHTIRVLLQEGLA